LKNAQKTLEKQMAAEMEAETKVQTKAKAKAKEAVVEEADVEAEVEAPKKPVTLNKQQIDEWKKQYGKVFRTVIGSDAFIWHRLTRKEYVALMMDENVSEDGDERLYQRQEMACKTAILWPENADEILQAEGCIASNLGGVIMERSGFNLPVTDEM